MSADNSQPGQQRTDPHRTISARRDLSLSRRYGGQPHLRVYCFRIPPAECPTGNINCMRESSSQARRKCSLPSALRPKRELATARRYSTTDDGGRLSRSADACASWPSEAVEIRFTLRRQGDFKGAAYRIGYIQIAGHGEVFDNDGQHMVHRETMPLEDVAELDPGTLASRYSPSTTALRPPRSTRSDSSWSIISDWSDRCCVRRPG